VFEFQPPEKRRPLPPEFVARITSNIDRGWPLLGFGKRKDMAVIFGYEGAGRRLLLSDYWASEEPSVMAAEEVLEVPAFLRRIDEPAPRPVAVRAGLELALKTVPGRCRRARRDHRRHVPLRFGRLPTLARGLGAGARSRAREAGEPVLPQRLDLQRTAHMNRSDTPRATCARTRNTCLPHGRRSKLRRNAMTSCAHASANGIPRSLPSAW
jgi:hypothetical protein